MLAGLSYLILPMKASDSRSVVVSLMFRVCGEISIELSRLVTSKLFGKYVLQNKLGPTKLEKKNRLSFMPINSVHAG